MVILICILLFVLTGIGCWALCAASDTDEYDDEEIKLNMIKMMITNLIKQ